MSLTVTGALDGAPVFLKLSDDVHVSLSSVIRFGISNPAAWVVYVQIPQGNSVTTLNFDTTFSTQQDARDALLGLTSSLGLAEL